MRSAYKCGWCRAALAGLALGLVALMATAAEAPPTKVAEDFEAYAPASNWLPKADEHKWRRVTTDDQSVAIVADAGYNGSKALFVSDPKAVANAEMQWLVRLDKNELPRQTWRFKYLMKSGRIVWAAQSGSHTYNVHVQIRSKTALLYFGNPIQNVAIPGEDKQILGLWHTVEVELDYATNRARARLGLADGDFYAWTDWVPMADTGQPTMQRFQFNGENYLDDIQGTGGK